MADMDQYDDVLREVFENWAADYARATKSGKKFLKQIKARLKKPVNPPDPPDPDKGNPHLSAYDKFGDSKIPVILFMDIVGYSKLSFDREQKDAIDLLNDVVRTALATTSCLWEDVVCLPTGDGMCLCFISATDIALKVAAEVQIDLARKNRECVKERKKKVCVRMGIHLGNVLRIHDLKYSFNLAGAAINLAQRAMDCGNEGHILCTQDAYKQLVQMEKQYKQSLKPIPKLFTVKHGLRLKLYNYCTQNGVGNPKDPRE